MSLETRHCKGLNQLVPEVACHKLAQITFLFAAQTSVLDSYTEDFDVPTDMHSDDPNL